MCKVDVGVPHGIPWGKPMEWVLVLVMTGSEGGGDGVKQVEVEW